MSSAPNVPVINTGTGVSQGNPIWVLPATNQAGVPFLGIATEELAPGEWVGPITFTLGTVTSPTGAGEFSLWNLDGFGQPEFFFSTNSPASTTANNVLESPVGGHAHFNWGFSEAGDWDVELTVAGEHITDGPLSSTRNFTFTVVPEPSSALLAVLGSTVLLRRRRSLVAIYGWLVKTSRPFYWPFPPDLSSDTSSGRAQVT